MGEDQPTVTGSRRPPNLVMHQDAWELGKIGFDVIDFAG